MEITNITVYSEDIIKKYIKFSMHKGKYHSVLKKILKAFWVTMISIICLCLLILALLEPSELLDLIPVAFFAIVVFVLVIVVIPKISYNNSKKLIDSNMQYIFTDDDFTIYSSCKYAMTNGTFKYDFLHKVYETNNCYYLYINKIAAYIIDKNGFENTTPEDLSKFLESKLPPKKFIRCK